MFALIRGLLYGSLFVGLALVLLPASLLRVSGVERPAGFGLAQGAGAALVLLGSAVALACVLSFAFEGRGTPARFDAPRRLVTRGPYRFARNPMYLGALRVLGGAALYCESLWLGGYAALLAVVADLFVRHYEEPRLQRTFGAEYDAYCRRVRRWRPGRRSLTVPRA
jgi:protein-S-isoprenylcysteine O-methyltransferase Ste14